MSKEDCNHDMEDDEENKIGTCKKCGIKSKYRDESEGDLEKINMGWWQ